MKKVLAICLTAIMIVCMSVTAFAAPNGFVSSPSGTPAPDVEIVVPGQDGCDATVVVTPFGDRFELPEAWRDLFENAYNQLINSGNLADLINGLADIIAGLGIDGTDLVVGDFFFVNHENCDNHDEHKNCKVTLAVDSLNRFVGLVFLNEDGKWELVKDAQVVGNGANLEFTVTTNAPYAVILDASKGSLVAPQTGDYGMMGLFAILVVLSAAVLAVVLVKRKKLED